MFILNGHKMYIVRARASFEFYNAKLNGFWISFELIILCSIVKQSISVTIMET